MDCASGAAADPRGGQVTYPFHDTEDEVVAARLVRRARIHRDGHWLCIRPGQTWEDGDVRALRPVPMASGISDPVQPVLRMGYVHGC